VGLVTTAAVRDRASRQVRATDDVLRHLRRARDHVDRHFAEPIDLETLAGVAGISKYHFQRLFTATYGRSPASYLSERRVERAQDLLRATNLTVTEVCHAVGFSSLGSFSSRFREVVGETPSAFQQRWAATGAPRIPGCYVFMWGLAERR
jgi:AraC-like DNA-binding protein